MARPVEPPASTEMRVWRRVLPLAFVAAFSLAVRAGIASIPLERDEGSYAYVAQHWLAGDLPYRDAFDHKPPGTFLVYAALFALGGTSIEAIHWLGHLSLLGTLGFAYLIARRLFSHTAGWMASLATLVLVTDRSVLGQAANTEVFAILPLSAGMYFALRAAESARVRSGLLVGLCGGLALCFKQVTFFVVACEAVWGPSSWWRWRRAAGDRRRRALVLLGASIAGVALVLAPTALYFVWHGAWGSFYDGVFGHNIAYGSRVSLRSYGANLWQRVQDLGPSQWPIWIAAGVGVAAPRGRRAVSPCLWWWLSSFVAVSVGGYFRRHYFILLMPPTALIAAHGLEVLGGLVARRRHEAVAAILAGAAVSWPLVAHRSYYFAPTPDAACRQLYGFNPFPESVAMARLLRDHSTADDRVFIFGSEPQILFYAGRPSASRYIFLYPLFAGGSDAEARQREVAEELQQRPRFVVIVHVASSFVAAPGALEGFEHVVTSMVHASYRRFAAASVQADGSYRIIRLTPDVASADPAHAELANGMTTLEVWERIAGR